MSGLPSPGMLGGNVTSDKKESDGAQAPRYRQAGIRMLTRFTEAASHARFTDAQSGFRAYSRRALEEIVPTERGVGVSAELLMKGVEHNLRILEVPRYHRV